MNSPIVSNGVNVAVFFQTTARVTFGSASKVSTSIRTPVQTRRTGDLGYLSAFTKAGTVDVARAEFPFRANENSLCFLVNGMPPMIDVDDASLVDRAALAANPAYAALLKAHPNLAIFPGPRSGPSAVKGYLLGDGAQRFEVDYVLVDGCHACARVGILRLAFQFDASGRFLGTGVLAVRPARR